MLLNCAGKLLGVPWTARRLNQFILKEISPEYSLEVLMLKLHYFGHLMWKTVHLKRPWCWERLKVGGEGDDRRWDVWMVSLTWWTKVWVTSGSWWWTGRPGVLQSMGSQRVGQDWVTELNWTETERLASLKVLICTAWIVVVYWVAKGSRHSKPSTKVHPPAKGVSVLWTVASARHAGAGVPMWFLTWERLWMLSWLWILRLFCDFSWNKTKPQISLSFSPFQQIEILFFSHKELYKNIM